MTYRKRKIKKDCMTCALNFYTTDDAGPHKLVKRDFECLVCQNKNRPILHSNHPAFEGETLECNKCHSYLISIKENRIYEDSIFVDDFVLTRDLIYKRSNFGVLMQRGNKTMYIRHLLTQEAIYQFVDKAKLLSKFKTIMAFV